MRNAFVNIHPILRGSSSRVAVNPGTLILMRLRHVPGRSPSLPLSHPSTSVLHVESRGVRRSLQREVHTEPRALYNTEASTHSLVFPLRVCHSFSLSLSFSLPLSMRTDRYMYHAGTYILWHGIPGSLDPLIFGPELRMHNAGESFSRGLHS